MFATPETGLIGLVLLFALLISGVPIGVSLGLVGAGGLIVALGFEPALIKAGVIVVETLTRYELGTLPLFMLMAHLFFRPMPAATCSMPRPSWSGTDVAGLPMPRSAGARASARSTDRAWPPPPRSGWWPCRKCASAAIPTRSPRERSQPAARWVRCFRRPAR
jgi:hypothetical protein